MDKEDAIVKTEKQPTKEIEKYISVDPQALILKAIEKNLPIETMEKLLAMRRELKAEASEDEYFISLSKFQAECPRIKKNQEVHYNNALRYKYASLDEIINQVKLILKNNGFSYTIKTKQNEKSITAICRSHHIAGHTEETELSIPFDQAAKMNVAQKVASALTYAKRYAFCDAFGIMTGDHDDDAISTEEKTDNKINKEVSYDKNKSSNSNKVLKDESLYSAIIILLNQKEGNQDIFLNKERIENKNKLDSIKQNPTALKDFYHTINNMVQERRTVIKNKGE